MAPALGALARQGGGERGDLAVADGAGPTSFTAGADPAGDPQAERGEEADRTEHEEQGRPQHHGDGDGSDQREAGGRQSGRRRSQRRRGRLRDRNGWRRPARARPRWAVHGAAPRVAGRGRQGDGAGRRAGAAADAQAAGPQRHDGAVADGGRSGDRFTGDPARHPAGELGEHHVPITGHVEHGVVRLERGVGEVHRRAGGPPHDVTAGGERHGEAGARAGLADDGDEGGDVGRTGGGGRARRHPAPPQQAGPRQRVVAADRAPIDGQRLVRVEPERVGEIAEVVVGRTGHDGDAPAAGGHQLDRRSIHVPPGRGSQPGAERRSRRRDERPTEALTRAGEPDPTGEPVLGEGR